MHTSVVTNFGAKGDGVTDDWAAIMAAFNNGRASVLASTTSSGSVITVATPPGVIAEPFNYYAQNLSTGTVATVHAADATTVTFLSALPATTGDVIRFDREQRGTVYFPAGTYFVSKPIDFMVLADFNVKVLFLGEQGLSTITGNFADYVLSRGVNDTGRSDQTIVIEKLTIVNPNPLGGGIRLGYAEGAAIRDCNIIANQGINTTNIDALIGGGFYWGSFEVSIENCVLSPGANVTGSVGLIIPSDGPIVNCRVVGFETGALFFGGEGAMAMKGCYFEGNTTGILPGIGPGNLGNSSTSNFSISGCWFKNNGTAISLAGGSEGLIEACRIEGANGAAPGGTNPQYGIHIPSGNGTVLYRGIVVTGQFDIAGVFIEGGDTVAENNKFVGVQSFNSGSGVAWHLPSTAISAQFTNCNVAPVYTISKLPAVTLAIATASYNSGTGLVTLTCSMGGQVGSFAQSNTWNISVSGVTPSGYNGSFVGTPVPLVFNQLTYPLASDPGSFVSAGSVQVVAVNDGGIPSVVEGNSYNVSDSNSATWGVAAPGGGSTHAKVRWNGTALTVVGA